MGGPFGEKGNAYRVLVRKAEGQRLLARLWHRWKENIKMDLSYIG